MTKHIFGFLALAALTALCLHPAQAQTNPPKLFKGKILIDVRTQAEWDEDHIAGAILIPYDQIAARIASVTKDKDAPIALYCRSGRRAELALETLKRLGYANVENLGGLQEARVKLGLTAKQ